MTSSTPSASAGTPVDLFVIGGGSAGVRAARQAAQRGARVALAEPGRLGGTCVNVGCIPKKLYSHAAGYALAFDEARGYGWRFAADPVLDWEALKTARAAEIARLNGVYLRLLTEAGVELVPARAQLAGGGVVEAGGRRFAAKHVLVATGGGPFVPELPGREHVVSSDAMFDLPRFPRRLVVVGGGYIACEMVSVFHGLGAEVDLVQRGGRLLAGFDDELARFLARELERTGVRLHFGAEVARVEPSGDALQAVLADGRTLAADVVLYATGRRPSTAGLGLEAAGVRLDARGSIAVDDRYETSAPGVFAVGDVSSTQPLTPVALAEAMAVVDHLYGDGRRRVDYDTVPTAVFTHPGAAAVGLSEEKARGKFGAVRVYRSDFRSLRHTLTGSQERTLVKLVVDDASDRVVGLHLVGADAGEIAQGFAVAMRAGATKADFDATIGIHPTVAEEFVTLRELTRR